MVSIEKASSNTDKSKFFIESLLRDKTVKHFGATCCQNQCMHQFTFNDCYSAHIWYHNQPQLCSLGWLHTVLASSIDEHGHVSLRFQHKQVCTTAFKLLYGLSNNKYKHALELCNNPLTQIIHGNIGNLNALQHPQHALMHYWILDFLQNNGDYDPASGAVHVPSYVTQESLYDLFRCDNTPSTVPLPSDTTFFEYIHAHFPD